MSRVNREGLTWQEWYCAAGCPTKASRHLVHLVRAWERGEDPTEWRAFPEWPGAEFSSTVSCGVWIRIDLLWYSLVEIPVYMPHSGRYIASSRRAAVDHQVPVGVPRG